MGDGAVTIRGWGQFALAKEGDGQGKKAKGVESQTSRERLTSVGSSS